MILKLHERIAGTFNDLTDKLLRKAGAAPDDVPLMVLACNTTMTQLMLKINPRYICRSPYVPASSFYPPVKAKEAGLALAEHARALFFFQNSRRGSNTGKLRINGHPTIQDQRPALFGWSG